MEYGFNIYEAEKYGVDEAIMLKNFKFWIIKNKANNKNEHEIDIDGKIVLRNFTFNSRRAFSELFPFWSEGQIKRILKSLIGQGILITGNFNKKNYDKTLWYALKDESLFIENIESLGRKRPIDESEPTNGLVDNNQPIPYNKPVSKPDNKHKYGEYKNVLLTDKEMNNLYDKLNGKSNRDDCIKNLDEGIELKGYKYKSHYLAILKWNKQAVKAEEVELPDYKH